MSSLNNPINAYKPIVSDFIEHEKGKKKLSSTKKSGDSFEGDVARVRFQKDAAHFDVNKTKVYVAKKINPLSSTPTEPQAVDQSPSLFCDQRNKLEKLETDLDTLAKSNSNLQQSFSLLNQEVQGSKLKLYKLLNEINTLKEYQKRTKPIFATLMRRLEAIEKGNNSKTALKVTTPSANSRLQPDFLPKVLIYLFLSYLDPESLESCCAIEGLEIATSASLWEAFDLKSLFPKLTIFDGREWSKSLDLRSFGLSVDDEPKLNKRQIIAHLRRLFSTLQIEDDVGITLLTIPKGISLKKGIAIEKQFKPYAKVVDPGSRDAIILSAFENQTIGQTYRVAITNSVLEDSYKLSIEAQTKLVAMLRVRRPITIEALTLHTAILLIYQNNLNQYKRNKKKLCNENFLIKHLFAEKRCESITLGSYMILNRKFLLLESTNGTGAVWAFGSLPLMSGV